MSALNRNLRELMAANKPPSRIAADVEAFVRNRERAAAEKAWREGELAGTRNQRDFQLYKDMKITELEYNRREAARCNPYSAEAYWQERKE